MHPMGNAIATVIQFIFLPGVILFDGFAAFIFNLAYYLFLYVLVAIFVGSRMNASDKTPGINWWRAFVPGEGFETLDIWRLFKNIPKNLKRGVIMVFAVLLAFAAVQFFKGGKVNPVNDYYEAKVEEEKPKEEPKEEPDPVEKTTDVGSTQQPSTAPRGVQIIERKDEGVTLIEVTVRPVQRSDIRFVNLFLPQGFKNVSTHSPPVGWGAKPLYNQYGELESVRYTGHGIEPGRHETFRVTTTTNGKKGNRYKVEIEYKNLSKERFKVVTK